ncbi:hypothetical protein CPB85DRAFT_152577 [Mucidula mucida]|nr:hypothetical protein CPB85DRAFT_152577 [Mucidula mucida]
MTNEDWIAHVRSHMGSTAHYLGTTAMAPQEMGGVVSNSSRCTVSRMFALLMRVSSPSCYLSLSCSLCMPSPRRPPTLSRGTTAFNTISSNIVSVNYRAEAV